MRNLLLLFTFCAMSLAWAQTSPVLRTDGTQTVTNKTITGATNDLALRFHATDCTSLGDGIEGEACYEQDDDTLYFCEPSAGACDTPGEWDVVAGSAGALGALTNVTEDSSTDNDVLVYVTDHWENQTLAETGVQPLDAELTALAGLSGTGVIIHTGAGTAVERTLTGSTNEVEIADGDGVSGNPTFTLGSKVALHLTANDSAIDFASVNDGASSATAETVTVTGAAIGDMCSVAPTTNILSEGVTIECWVSAGDTVSYFVRNDSGSAEDLASATYRAVVIQSF